MDEPKLMLVTSEMMREGETPVIFTGGACNIQRVTGPERNPGRDPLARWLDRKGWSYFDPQIHPCTHGRDYLWEIDSPQEKHARETARLRVYEIIPTTIASVAMLEIMDDARWGRRSIVWFNGPRTFSPIGLGDRDEIRADAALRKQVGEMAYQHLVAYVSAGRQLRKELALMVADCPHIEFVDSLEELTHAISRLLG